MPFPPALVARWQALSLRGRVVLAIFAGALVAGAVCLASGVRDTRVPLFAAALAPDQIAEVDRQLAAWNVPFIVSGATVRVDPRRRNDLLLRLALAQIPHPHLPSSAETLATVGALTPQAVLDAQTRAGLEDDLALALRGIDGVGDAHVIVAPASDGVFADEHGRPATASVQVSLLPGGHLGPQTIAGIRAFVAAGVPGLDADHVTILDQRGVALGAAAGDAEGLGADVQAGLQSALDQAFGTASTIVRVHVDVDARTREIDDLRSVAAGGLIGDERSDETFAGDKKHYVKGHRTLQRGTQSRTERTAIPAGAQVRLSIAVFVDAHRGFDLGKIRSLAAASSGFDPARGDQLSVEAVAFAAPPAAHGVVAATVAALVGDALPATFAVVAGLAALRFGLPAALPLLARFESRPAIAPHGSAAEIRRRLAGEAPGAVAAVLGALPAATAAAVLELYDPAERAEIASRLGRPVSRLFADWEDLLGIEPASHPA